MNNCPHEAWDFGALQCSGCGAVKDHVTDAEYAKLAAEAQALRRKSLNCAGTRRGSTQSRITAGTCATASVRMPMPVTAASVSRSLGATRGAAHSGTWRELHREPARRNRSGYDRRSMPA